MLLEAVGDQEPGLAALSAGDVASFAVNDVAGSGEFGGPPWCAAGQLGGLGGQVCALACRAEDFAVFSGESWSAVGKWVRHGGKSASSFGNNSTARPPGDGTAAGDSEHDRRTVGTTNDSLAPTRCVEGA